MECKELIFFQIALVIEGDEILRFPAKTIIHPDSQWNFARQPTKPYQWVLQTSTHLLT